MNHEVFQGCQVSKYSEFLGSAVHHGFLVKTVSLMDLGITGSKLAYLLDRQFPARERLDDQLKSLNCELKDDGQAVMKKSADEYM